ncbi:hypothetical protein D9615_003354 [Tricholomella constricta]|uniref:Uncharacterized protein n=1 Tax=Tricholomella constricta TaxID=117010 RepID=A0A8H5HJH5_9AGAR|nr:hypothetical protein D9615_003354 [Tricholomella constricta]
MTRSGSRLPGRDDDDDDDLYSYFNKSVSAVQAHADHFEQEYARPALRTSQAFFDDRPIAATFIVIFVFLSFLPVVFFLGLSLFAVASFTIIALTSTVIASATVVLTLLSLLVLTLLITLVSSAFLTLSGVSLYASVSLLSLVRKHGRLGVSKWAEHMSNFLVGSRPVQLPSRTEPGLGLSLGSGFGSTPRVHAHEEWTDSDADGQHEVVVKVEVKQEEPEDEDHVDEDLYIDSAVAQVPPHIKDDMDIIRG